MCFQALTCWRSQTTTSWCVAAEKSEVLRGGVIAVGLLLTPLISDPHSMAFSDPLSPSPSYPRTLYLQRNQRRRQVFSPTPSLPPPNEVGVVDVGDVAMVDMALDDARTVDGVDGGDMDMPESSVEEDVVENKERGKPFRHPITPFSASSRPPNLALSPIRFPALAPSLSSPSPTTEDVITRDRKQRVQLRRKTRNQQRRERRRREREVGELGGGVNGNGVIVLVGNNNSVRIGQVDGGSVIVAGNNNSIHIGLN